ncbi:Uncharacterised protein [uncultured archaeon]|nr:Uncharacterised protein [uncultured archaeon]
MNTKMETIKTKPSGFVESLRDFLKILEDMERKKEKVRNVSGKFEGPFDSKGEYKYTVKIGIGKNDLRRYHHHKARLRSTGAIEELQEPAIKVFENGDTVSVVANLPRTRDEDIGLEIAGSRVLRITAITPDGKLVRNIPVSEEKNIDSIKEASFKNGILMIRFSIKNLR